MKKNILIVEDNEYYMNFAVDAIVEIDNINVFKALDVATAYKYAIEQNIDVFIVDIILDRNIKGDVSGVKFVEGIRTINKYKFTPIIFTTSLEDPQLYAYSNLHCYRYFEKTYDKKEFINTIMEALDYCNPKENKQFVYYRKEGIIFSQKIEDIVYVENCTKFIEYHCVDGVKKAPYKTVNKILEELDQSRFIQCSKHTIVNKEYIESIDSVNRFIKLANNYGDIEIGSRIKKEFMSRLIND